MERRRNIWRYQLPKVQTLLNRQFEVLVGLSTKQKRDARRLWSPILREMINTKLSRHEVKRKKEGHEWISPNPE